MELRDSAVVRPLFFTAWLIEAASVVFEIVPISRIAPLLATCPVTTFPIEQSTLLLGSELFFISVATVCAPLTLQLTSISPG